MAHFFELEGRMSEVTREFFEMTQDASDNLKLEVKAVCHVQSVFRASKIRKNWHEVTDAARFIQRVFFRGCAARARCTALRMERNRKLNALFFHHCAAAIQKFFRGWRSRKHLHDFYGRGARCWFSSASKKQSQVSYITRVEKRGAYTVDYLQQEHQQKLVQAKQEEEARVRHEFDNLAGELHHLVSTRTCPGVYNPPYNDALPRAFEKPIEQHLRDCCQSRVPRSLRFPPHRVAIANASPRSGMALGFSHSERQEREGAPAGPPQDLPDRKPHASRSASVGRMQKIQGPFRSKEQIEVSNSKANNIHRSIQSASHYEAVEYDRKMQQRISKLTRVSPIDFVAPGLPPERPPPSSVHTSVPYRERPVELRNEYTELPKIRDKPPFFTALAQGKHFDDYGEQPLLPSGHV